MQQRTDRPLMTLMWPGLVLAAAGWLVPRAPLLPPPYLALLSWLPYAMLFMAAALAWRFHSSRGLLMSVLLVGLLAALQHPPISPIPALLPFCCGFICPAAFLCISCLKERGVASVSGLSRLLGMMILALAAVHEAQYPNQALAHVAVTGPLGVDGAAYSVGLMALLGRMYLVPSVLESASFGVLLSTGLALSSGSAAGAELFVMAGGLMTITALIQYSYGMAYLDELTGIPARRALKQELAGLSGRYTIAMVDIDHFKGFNDTYGHDVGDQCLRLVASRLQKVTGGGRAYRYGGEEFTVLFPSKSAKDALDSLEQLRESIENNPMILRNPDRPRRKPKDVPRGEKPAHKVTVTVSIGVAEKSERLPTSDDVIKAADKALYRAKKKGRNQVCR